ncbi:MAG: phytanoyl-CoA dioxygenase family protein [Cyanobacteriota bacterium]|nr:phytanoyl-CoA dioxygenase family protein [Cyanobacteriota bacterium]
MAAQLYLDTLPLAEKLYREQPDTAARIYSQPLLDYLRDGVVIFPGVIPLDLLEQMDQDLERLADLRSQDPIMGMVGVDGPRQYYEARHLHNLDVTDFRLEPPGLKLLDLQRFFVSARSLAFSPAILSFMEELFGSPAALIQSLTFWKSSEQSVHQDFSYVNHHRSLAQLAAAWIPLEDIRAEAGPLVYYKGSHRPDALGFFDWGQGEIRAGRDHAPAVFDGYRRHLETIIENQGFEPSIFLPKRGDLLIWHGALIHGGTPMQNPALTRRSLVCHYTSMASHRGAQRFRVGQGYSFDEPPQLPYRPSPLRLAAQRLIERLRGGAPKPVVPSPPS